MKISTKNIGRINAAKRLGVDYGTLPDVFYDEDEEGNVFAWLQEMNIPYSVTTVTL